MVDTTALVALVVAAVALVIALTQLAQQLLATAYVIRKCDSIVTGTLTKGGSRQWHWRQFRFTVIYQSIVFTLPSSVYRDLGIISTVQISQTISSLTASIKIRDRAKETRPKRTSSQACWISLLQDLIAVGCLRPEDICTKEESGDRIPEDLTVAPNRVDCMTILLGSIAMGMQVFRYSPTTGEIFLGGGSGSISSSSHPVLGVLLHYSVISEEKDRTNIAVSKHNAHALCHSEGIWANAVFGRFRDRSYKPNMVSLSTLLQRKIPLLQRCGWSDGLADGDADSVAGAACFMALGHVDVYEIAPPSVFRPYAAHFAEIIVKAHHVSVLRFYHELRSSGSDNQDLSGVFKFYILGEYNCSSPHLTGDLTRFKGLYEDLTSDDPKVCRIISSRSVLKHFEPSAEDSWHNLCVNEQDPSTYCSPELLWDIIRLVDICIPLVLNNVPPPYQEDFRNWSDQIIAGSVYTLSRFGAPSWGNASNALENWPETIASFHQEAMRGVEKTCTNSEHLMVIRRNLRLHAELSALRSAYCTVMMRAAHALGPGLTTNCKIETALAYMA